MAYTKRIRKYNSYKGNVGKVAKNHLKRRFMTDRPYQKLVADVSEFRCGHRAMRAWIRYSNESRIKEKLGGQSPIEFRISTTEQAV